MGERDRNQYYRDRNEGRYRENPSYRSREGSEWDRDVDYSPWQPQNETERNDRGYYYGPRSFSERNYGERDYTERDYGRRDYGQRNYGEQDYSGRSWREQNMYDPYGTRSRGYSTSRFPGTFGSYEDQVGARDYARRSEGNYDSRNYDYRTRDLYRPTWGEDYDYDYRGRERGREHRGIGQQLREVGERAVRSVKRAFRGPKGYKRSDERIREDVNDRLSMQDDLDPSEIEVSVSNSEVTLTGSVQSRQEKFLAEEIADDVSGVTEVHNQLRVGRQQAQTTSTTESIGAQAVTDAARNRNARA
jgi:BON domain